LVLSFQNAGTPAAIKAQGMAAINLESNGSISLAHSSYPSGKR
jgi:hypothetical protein